jgi:hypothetical protein
MQSAPPNQGLSFVICWCKMYQAIRVEWLAQNWKALTISWLSPSESNWISNFYNNSMASTTWLQYYAGEISEGTSNTVSMVQNTFHPVLDNITKSHLDKPPDFRSTITANTTPATIVIVPHNDCNIHLLHRGSLVFARGLGQMLLVSTLKHQRQPQSSAVRVW